MLAHQASLFLILSVPILMGAGRILRFLGQRYQALLEKLRSLETCRAVSPSLFVITKICQQITLFGVQPVNLNQSLPVDKKFEFDITQAVDAYKNAEPGTDIGATFAWTADSATFGALSLVDDSTLKIAFVPNGALGTTVITGVPTLKTPSTDGFQPNNIVITLVTVVGAPVDFSGVVTLTDTGVDSPAPVPAPTPAPAVDTPAAPVTAPTAPADSGSTPTTTTPTDTTTAPVAGDTSAPATPTTGDTTAASGTTDTPTTTPPADSGSTTPVAPIDSAPAVSTPTAPVNAPDSSVPPSAV